MLLVGTAVAMMTPLWRGGIGAAFSGHGVLLLAANREHRTRHAIFGENEFFSGSSENGAQRQHHWIGCSKTADSEGQRRREFSFCRIHVVAEGDWGVFAAQQTS